MTEEPNRKPLSDPTYNFGDYKAQVFGGRLRWMASICALLALGLLLYWIVAKVQPRTYVYGIEVKGATAYGIVSGAFGVCFLLAVINWRNWFKVKAAARRG